MRVFVTGGAGAIGNHALPALTASGHEVTAMVRTPSKAEAVRNAGAVGISRSLPVPGRAALLLGDRTTSLTRSLRVSNRRFRTACQWAPRYPSVREGYRAMARRESPRH
jgi:nucleoside-diphosphate-sugar epimerase